MAIRLREIRPEDSEQMRVWRNLPEVSKYMYTSQYISSEEHARWFVEMQNDASAHYWIIEVDGKGVGVANITDMDERNRRCYWGFYLAEEIRGKGVGSYVWYFLLNYVFEELGLNKLCAEVLSWNENALAMYDKYGFRNEGLLREHIIKDGQHFDVVMFGILRNDWVAMKPQIENKLKQKGLL